MLELSPSREPVLALLRRFVHSHHKFFPRLLFHAGTNLPCPPKQRNYKLQTWSQWKMSNHLFGESMVLRTVKLNQPVSIPNKTPVGRETEIRLSRHRISALLHFVPQLRVWQLWKPPPLVQLLLFSLGLSAPLLKLSLHTFELPDWRKRAAQHFSWDWQCFWAKIEWQVKGV